MAEFKLSGLDKYREHNQLEAKRASGGFPGSFWETYSAFANTDGGVILLGVKKSGTYRRNHDGDYHCSLEEISLMFRDAAFVTQDAKVLDKYDGPQKSSYGPQKSSYEPQKASCGPQKALEEPQHNKGNTIQTAGSIHVNNQTLAKSQQHRLGRLLKNRTLGINIV